MNEWPIDRLHWIFRSYADVDFPTSGAPLYAAIANALADDDEILELAATVQQGQPPPNLLFAAVHYLLLSGTQHELTRYYPDLTSETLPAENAYPHFRAFCIEHGKGIAAIIRTRRVQTNVLERCGLLLPAFAVAAKALGTHELAVIEIGASAGLNLLWDQYHYSYGDMTWGDEEALVRVETEVRGEGLLPPLPYDLRSVWSRGIDLDPVDLSGPDCLLWQRALMWPERLDRQQRLTAARALIDTIGAPQVVAGDAVEALPALIASAPGNAGLCVLASYALYQFPQLARERVFEIIRERATPSRPIAFLRLDAKAIGDPHGTLQFSVFEGSADVRTVDIARGHPHGRWIEWLS